MTTNWRATGISDRFIKEVVAYCSNHTAITRVVLFGSRARGDHSDRSDIDLAITTVNCSHTEQNLIALAVEEMTTPSKIDILFTNRLQKEKLLANINKEGMIIYEQGQAVRKA
ncbi:nucleotidyltransferase domain-containing protein (plasmid) [Pseudalkalibacillus hwajinpoensis]|uniref:nucleotidyltransferase domain-containing protein n=1 Tax=Guptibacillus hwajinpoensis TaxID=208199 RepID=UPI00325B044F